MHHAEATQEVEERSLEAEQRWEHLVEARARFAMQEPNMRSGPLWTPIQHSTALCATWLSEESKAKVQFVHDDDQRQNFRGTS